MTLADPNIWANLFTLTVLEIVLGIDNLVFITVVTARLPQAQQKVARRLGLILAMLMRLLLLAAITWLATLTQPLITVSEYQFSGREVIFILGGFFLIYKAVQEIRSSLYQVSVVREQPSSLLFGATILQIMIFDIIFSLDSVITAVGLSQHYWVMATAIVIAIFVMLVASEPTSRFIVKYPSVKMLALSFLILVGLVLLADGFGQHLPRGYLYVAIGFSMFVEALNIFATKVKNNT